MLDCTKGRRVRGQLEEVPIDEVHSRLTAYKQMKRNDKMLSRNKITFMNFMEKLLHEVGR